MLLPLGQIRLFVADGNEVIRVTCMKAKGTKYFLKGKEMFNQEVGGCVASTLTDTAFGCQR